MSASDLFWDEDPLRVSMGNYDSWKSTQPEERWPDHDRESREPVVDPTRCCQCWREVYGSFPNKPLCREHFWEAQQRSIAALVASRAQKAS